MTADVCVCVVTAMSNCCPWHDVAVPLTATVCVCVFVLCVCVCVCVCSDNNVCVVTLSTGFNNVIYVFN